MARSRRRRGGVAYQDLILSTPGLVSYWGLGETSGVARDRKGTNHGTYTGTLTRGVPGIISDDRAVQAGGAGYVAATQVVLPLNPSFEGWIYRTGAVADAAIAGQWSGSHGAMLFLSGDALVMYIEAAPLIGPTVTANTWHHLAGTYNGTNGVVYIDGALIAGPTALTGPVTSPAVPFDIGAYSNGAGSKLFGTLDDVAYYNRVLTAGEIADHYRAGKGI